MYTSTRLPIVTSRAMGTQRPLRRNLERILRALDQSDIQCHFHSALERPTRVLGLDINTSSTGYTVLSGQGKLCSWGNIATSTSPSHDILGIADTVRSNLVSIKQAAEEKPAAPAALQWHVGIEDFMRTYSFGRFHNKGIFQLAQLNGVVSYVCWQLFPPERPLHAHPTYARGYFGIVASKKGTVKGAVKDDVAQFVIKREPDASSTWVQHVNSMRYPEATYDIADSYIIALWRWQETIVEALLLDEALELKFYEQYLQLVSERKSRTPTVEQEQLADMSDAAKRIYVRSLLDHGVRTWMKKEQTWEL